jgi:hypothetical protein
MGGRLIHRWEQSSNSFLLVIGALETGTHGLH